MSLGAEVIGRQSCCRVARVPQLRRHCERHSERAAAGWDGNDQEEDFRACLIPGATVVGGKARMTVVDRGWSVLMPALG